MAVETTVRRTGGGLPVRALHVEELDPSGARRTLLSSVERAHVGSAPGNDVVLEDPSVSRYHLELEGAAEGIRVEDLDSTNGTRIGPVLLRGSAIHVAPGAVLELGRRRLRVDDGGIVMLDVHGSDALCGIRGRSPLIRRVMATVGRAALHDISVLIVGESGTGKELLAHAIHQLSSRAGGPFVTVDCAAIPPALFAAELFGNERGAFTGADRRRIGALERASGGTVFLDEVGELPPSLQAALLGVLERRRMARLGSDQEVTIDVRVVSATNRDLRREVNAGGFRLDLFHRLAVVSIEVPPLRERRDDIPLLIEHFLRQIGDRREVGDVFSAEALSELVAYPFPGNIRELRNLVASSIALGTDPVLPSVTSRSDVQPRDLISELTHLGYKEARSRLLQEFEQRYLTELFTRTQGNVRRAARDAGIDRSYLTELLSRHGIGRFKPED